MKMRPAKIALQGLAGLLLPAAAVAAPQSVEDSVWRNPQNSVHVRLHACGQSRCGTVLWANEKAKADSARGGTSNLIGTQLFRNFHETNAKAWTGKVFVPDMGRVFTGEVTIIDVDTMIARGCLMKKLGCKSQRWSRVK